MDLQIKYSISAKADFIFFSDQGSTWTSPNRSDVALVGLVKYNGISSPEFVFTEVSYDNTLTNSDVTEFTSDYVKDGWHTIALAVVPLSAGASEGNIRFNTSTQLLEIYQSGDWEELTDFDKILDSETLTVEKKEILLYSKLVIKLNCIWIDIANNKCKDKKCSLDVFWFSRGQLFSLLNQFSIGNRFESQKMIENVTKTVSGL